MSGKPKKKHGCLVAVAVLFVLGLVSSCTNALTRGNNPQPEQTAAPAEIPQISTELPTVSETELIPTEISIESSASSAPSPEFKELMDSYEAFFDEYIHFMQTYQNSDDPLSMLTLLSDYMTKYADYMQKLSEIEDMELSLDDEAYYLEVSARIYAKLSALSVF